MINVYCVVCKEPASSSCKSCFTSSEALQTHCFCFSLSPLATLLPSLFPSQHLLPLFFSQQLPFSSTRFQMDFCSQPVGKRTRAQKDLHIEETYKQTWPWKIQEPRRKSFSRSPLSSISAAESSRGVSKKRRKAVGRPKGSFKKRAYVKPKDKKVEDGEDVIELRDSEGDSSDHDMNKETCPKLSKFQMDFGSTPVGKRNHAQTDFHTDETYRQTRPWKTEERSRSFSSSPIAAKPVSEYSGGISKKRKKAAGEPKRSWKERGYVKSKVKNGEDVIELKDSEGDNSDHDLSKETCPKLTKCQMDIGSTSAAKRTGAQRGLHIEEPYRQTWPWEPEERSRGVSKKRMASVKAKFKQEEDDENVIGFKDSEVDNSDHDLSKETWPKPCFNTKQEKDLRGSCSKGKNDPIDISSSSDEKEKSVRTEKIEEECPTEVADQENGGTREVPEEMLRDEEEGDGSARRRTGDSDPGTQYSEQEVIVVGFVVFLRTGQP